VVIDLDVERPVAGGRMLARHDGRVVLVAGAIPGERVRVRVERAVRGVLWADVVEVLAASPHRRDLAHDPACGGQVYRHIDLPTQRVLKAQIVGDAFWRIGKMALEVETPVEASPEAGYRLRARLHVRGGRAGFFRTGSHDLCDAAATLQLRPEASAAVDELLARHPLWAASCREVVVAENVAATQRVLHVVGDPEALAQTDRVLLPAATTGVTVGERGGFRTLAGASHVHDTAMQLFGGAPPVPAATTWARHPAAFFQGNRYLIGALVEHVLAQTAGDRVIDLYAGVGLFTVALLARGVAVTAVEHDPAALADLQVNARPWPDTAVVIGQAVESARLDDAQAGTVILDPPRTGLSARALASIAGTGARLVYVSCDPPTLARDAGKLVAAGYRLATLRAFDMFPNTAHVETVATLVR
jgi:tRNA/tmRNA/rRNA uracil-C5-methylase (TrmA/RlmC/RlmD family)